MGDVSDKPYWAATVTGPLRIGWGQLGYRKPYWPKRRKDPKAQSKMDKRHHAVAVELERRMGK